MQVLVINPVSPVSNDFCRTNSTPTTREEMVSYFNSQDRSQFIRLTRTIEGLLEFELNNWEPIHTSLYSWKDETKEPPVDGPKLLDLLRQTFTWKENICVWTDVSFEGDQRVAVRCKDRSDFLQKMSSTTSQCLLVLDVQEMRRMVPRRPMWTLWS